MLLQQGGDTQGDEVRTGIQEKVWNMGAWGGDRVLQRASTLV